MKILIGMTRSDTMASGSFKHIVQIGDRFRTEGLEVAYVIGKSGPASEYLKNRDFKVYELPSLERDLAIFKDVLSLLQLIFIILRFRPDICSWHTAKIGALGRVASFLTFRKSYYVPHGVPFFESVFNKGHKTYRSLEKVLAWLPSTIIGVCRFDTEQYLKLGVPARKTLTIHNGMKMMANRDLGLMKGDRIVFITAARFEDQKDYETLALALHKVTRTTRNFELHIYGDGRKEELVRQLFAEFDDIVHFKGVVEDLTTALMSAHVFILSSHWEGLPRTIIEAMSCKMPVIATDVGGVCELINHDRTGYLVQTADSNAMSEYMTSYINDPDRIIAHGCASYSKYKAEFTLEKMLDCYVSAYIPEAIASRKLVDGRITDV